MLNFFASCGLLVSLLFLQHSHLQSLKGRVQVSDAQIHEKDRATSFQLTIWKLMPSFGFANVLADWQLLNFIQYFGESEERQVTGYATATQFFDVVIDRDPRFVGAYLYLTNTVSVYAGKPLEAIGLMEKGLASMTPVAPSRSFFVWRYKGTDEMLFLGDNKSAQQSFQTAADWAEQSDDVEAALVARLSRQTAAFLAANPNSTPALINGWMNVLSRAIDDVVRQEAINQIEALGGEILVSQEGQVTVRYKNNQ